MSSEHQQQSQNNPEGELAEEFQRLGHNLKAAVQAAWHSDVSQRLQQEIRAGLAGVESSLKEAASELNSPEGRENIHSHMAGVGQRVRSGLAEADLRGELLAALKTINAELQKARPPGDRPAE
jgi:hypothetical protein